MEKDTRPASHIETAADANSMDATTTAEDDEEFSFTLGKALAMLSFQLGYLSDIFVLVAASAVLTTINRDLGASANYSWIATSQIVGAAALSPVVGRFGDIFGRRDFLLAGNVIALVGNVIAATANSVNVVIGGGTLIGIGNAMHQISWACLGEVVPKRSRGFAFGFFESTISLGSAFGAVTAYAFINNGSWRPIFWLAFAIDAAALVLVFLFYHPINQYIHEEGKTTWDQIKETDFIGTFLFIAGLVLFLLGISFGGTKYPWRSAGTIAPLVIGFVTLVVLGIYEGHAQIKYPIFPPVIFRNIRGYTVILVGVFLYGMLFYATSVLWPQQVQSLYTQNNIDIGWYASAQGLGGMIIGPIFGWALRRFGHAPLLLTFIITCMTVCCGAQAIVTPESNKGSTALVVLIGGFVSGSSAVSAAMVQVGVKHEFIGVATGVLICARTVGGAVGTTIYVSILQNKLASGLATDVGIPLAMNGVPPASIPAVIESLVAGEVSSPSLASLTPTALLAAAAGLKQAFAHAFRVVYLVTIAFGVAGIIAVAFSANVDHLMTQKIEIKLEEGAHMKSHMDTGEGHIIHRSEEKERQ